MTYDDFLAAYQNDELMRKVRVACVLAAEAIRNEDPGTANHAARLTWAKGAYADPETEAIRMLRAVLAQNMQFTLAVVLAASDASVQTAVNNAVDVFAV